MLSRTSPSAPGTGSSSGGFGGVTQEKGSGTLQPTFTGHVATTYDALILFEACLSGNLNRVLRRPNYQERNSSIGSGSVFIYVEKESGIKRWTDGVRWSPSRNLNDFLVYRELAQPFPSGKRKVIEKQKRRAARLGGPYPRPSSTGESYPPTTSQSTSFSNTPTPGRELIGSLTDSYGFKSDGLVKKTISVTVENITQHLVCYYNMDDIQKGLLQRPSKAPDLSTIRPRLGLILQNFRDPLEEVEGHQGIYGELMSQQIYQISSSYHPHAAYSQHGQQQGASAEYAVGPPMRYRNHEPFYQQHPSTMPSEWYTSPSSVLPPPSQAQHPGMCSQASLQQWGISAPSPIDPRRSRQILWETMEDARSLSRSS